MKSEASKIDFVILWVDDADPEWKVSRMKYDSNFKDTSEDVRYRDWGLLKYWFRAIEKYASWVNNVYFVTCGHLPKWLNINHPKLRIIKHEDYIDKKYLPTFNSNVIEMNLYKIKSLSEKFVVFNDDMFINAPVEAVDFFRGGLPCDSAQQSFINPVASNFQYSHMLVNNLTIINKHFNKKQTIKDAPFKHYNLKYGPFGLINFPLTAVSSFTGLKNYHIPVSHLKSTFINVWELEKDQLEAVNKNKFRKNNDLSHWLFRYWNIASNNFYPRKSSIGKCYTLGIDNKRILRDIKKSNHKLLCLNDSDAVEFSYSEVKNSLISAMEEKYHQKSSYEK